MFFKTRAPIIAQIDQVTITIGILSKQDSIPSTAALNDQSLKQYSIHLQLIK